MRCRTANISEDEDLVDPEQSNYSWDAINKGLESGKEFGTNDVFTASVRHNRDTF